MRLDQKQCDLIAAWVDRATRDGDEYGRFMSAWVAFNAFGYALFARIASKRRPDLSEDRGLVGLAGKVQASGSLELRADGRVRIRIEQPGRVQIDIRERYTEDLVFTEFARCFGPSFGEWLADAELATARDAFCASLQRPNGCYVINMLRASQYREDAKLEDLVRSGVVVAVTDRDDLHQLVDALYQVRCNVFHGEKEPGVINDDRIVRTARPFLLGVLGRSMAAQPALAADGAARRR